MLSLELEWGMGGRSGDPARYEQSQGLIQHLDGNNKLVQTHLKLKSCYNVSSQFLKHYYEVMNLSDL